MGFHFAVVLVFLLLAAVFVLAALAVGAVVRPKFPNKDKESTYECGERPIGKAWFNFNPRFYIIALIFVIFDVEIALIFPVGVVFKEWTEKGDGWFAFVEILVFIVILVVGLLYAWAKGDLNWIKQLKDERP